MQLRSGRCVIRNNYPCHQTTSSTAWNNNIPFIITNQSSNNAPTDADPRQETTTTTISYWSPSSILSPLFYLINNSSLIRNCFHRRHIHADDIREVHTCHSRSRGGFLIPLLIIIAIIVLLIFLFPSFFSFFVSSSCCSKYDEMADYALDSLGGAVIGVRCTKTLSTNPSVLSIFGIPLINFHRSPSTIINPSVYPGECYAFEGSSGIITIRLAMKIYITSVTLEHIPKSLAIHGKIDTAPKEFAILGLPSETSTKSNLLGNFTYKDNRESIQNFAIHNASVAYQFMEFSVLSNYGHPHHTCVYRLRVHGTPVVQEEL